MYAPASTRKWLVDEADHERLAKAAARIFSSEPEVIAVYLYGSAARREPAADLDLAVLADAPIHPRRLEALAGELQGEGAPGGPEIDLRQLWQAAPRFQIEVLKHARLLFERSRGLRLEREALVMSRWADFKPTWERMRRRMLDRWRRG